MRFAAETGARLMPIPRAGLPAWCDRFLAVPDAGDFFATRAWYDTILAHALPDGSEPLAVLCNAGQTVLLPLLRFGGRLTSLTTPYSLSWRPLSVPGSDAAALAAAGRDLGRLLRKRPPVVLEALEEGRADFGAILNGVREAGLVPVRYRHFGNWHEVLTPDLSWEDYLASRPPALRTTIRRKLARAAREMWFERITAPGPALDAGIAAYVDVRARSWKPFEPFPDFDAALMRRAAALGLLRLGVLRGREDGRAVAAQYWITSGGRAWLLKLAHAEASRAASPGTVLTAMMIRLLLEEDRVQELDFGRGDDTYKRLWVGRRRQRYGTILADPRTPGGALVLARQAAGQGTRCVRRWLRRAGNRPDNLHA